MAMKNCVGTILRIICMIDHTLIICHIEEPYIGTHKSLWSKLTARKFCAIKGVKAVSLVN